MVTPAPPLPKKEPPPPEIPPPLPWPNPTHVPASPCARTWQWHHMTHTYVAMLTINRPSPFDKNIGAGGYRLGSRDQSAPGDRAAGGALRRTSDTCMFHTVIKKMTLTLQHIRADESCSTYWSGAGSPSQRWLFRSAPCCRFSNSPVGSSN